MLKILLCNILLIITLFANTLNAQSVAINTDGSIANNSAILDVKSIDKGILTPRMTKLQKNTITTPVAGLLIYQNAPDSIGFHYYNGLVWVWLQPASAQQAWLLTGNAATNTSTNFIGTTDNTSLRFRVNNFNAGFIDFQNDVTTFGYKTNSGIVGQGVGTTAFGANTLAQNKADNNTAIGTNALQNNTLGSSNTAIGFAAMQNAKLSTQNVAIGSNALQGNLLSSGATNNVAIGELALYSNTTGSHNIAVGFKALLSDTSGSDNIALGRSALTIAQNKTGLIAIGDYALANNGTGTMFPTEGANNTAIGSKSLAANTSGSDNLGVGFQTLTNNTIGNENVGIGSYSLNKNITGTSNIAIGFATLFNHYKFDNNVAIGPFSLQNDTTGINNVAVGHSAMYNNSYGINNTAIGDHTLNTNDSGSNNTALGALADVASIGLKNATAIGSNAYVSVSNAVVIGSIKNKNNAPQDTKVGIGVTDPTEKLEIGNGRLRFRGNLTGGLAHGVAFTNNAGTADRAFMGLENDTYFGFYNTTVSTWNIRLHNTSGEMGINKQPGITTNESRLQVKQTNTTATRGIGLENSLNTNHWDMWLDNTVAAPDFNFMYNGTNKGYIQNSSGSYIVASDLRLKKDITLTNSVLQQLTKIPVYNYKYTDNSNTDPLIMGFMAQDVQQYFPNATPTKTNEKGEVRLGLNYNYLTAITVKAIQEQQQIINQQATTISNQAHQITTLEARLLRLEKLMLK